MHHFDEIFVMAANRHDGPDALNEKLSKPKSLAELAEMPEDRWLSIITKTIFQAGFNWKVIENKWDGFEIAFDGFDVGRCAFMDDEKFDALLQDTRIVRNGTKIAAVRDNAAFLLELRAEGGAGCEWHLVRPRELLELVEPVLYQHDPGLQLLGSARRTGEHEEATVGGHVIL